MTTSSIDWSGNVKHKRLNWCPIKMFDSKIKSYANKYIGIGICAYRNRGNSLYLCLPRQFCSLRGVYSDNMFELRFNQCLLTDMLLKRTSIFTLLASCWDDFFFYLLKVFIYIYIFWNAERYEWHGYTFFVSYNEFLHQDAKQYLVHYSSLNVFSCIKRYRKLI